MTALYRNAPDPPALILGRYKSLPDESVEYHAYFLIFASLYVEQLYLVAHESTLRVMRL